MRPSSSRRFCRRTLLRRAAATGAVGPLVIPAAALGRNGRTAPSGRVVTGYIGTGPRGMLNIREQLTCPEVQLVAVCDVWKPRRDRAKALVDAHYRNGDCRAYADFRELLARADIDAVGIATTDHWHVPIAVAAARAGKDVCVEKPLGVSIEEDLVCRQVIGQYQRVFQYGTEARAMDACRFGCELVRNGRIGQIREIRVKAPNSRPGGSTTPRDVPKQLHYELWLGPAPWRPYSGCPDRGTGWYHVYDYALGFIAGWGAHPLDLLQWAFDTHRYGPWEVEATGTIPTSGCNDAVIDWDAVIRLANGVPIRYWAHGLPKQEDPQLAKLGNYTQFLGTEGWVAVYYGGMLCEPDSLRTTVIGPDEIHLPASRGQERNFIECVQSRKTPVSNIDDAVHSDLVSHVCDIAIRCGRPLRWDPIGARFLGDEQANRMRRRAMRPPWCL